MIIAFVTSGLPFTGETVTKQALGGSETAMVCLAKSLASRGHEVRVYCECPAPGEYDGVRYYPVSQFGSQSAIMPVDVLIVSRWAQFLRMPVQAGLRVLWCHDVLVDPEGFKDALWQADMLMLLSKFHIDNYCGPEGSTDQQETKDKLPDLRPYIWQTKNGVDTDLIEQNIKPKVPGKLIFTSRPERGLHFLLDRVMPRLWERKPDLRLHFCSYSVAEEKVPESVLAIHARCAQLASQYPNNVIDMGPLRKTGLYQQISSAQLMVYPTTFPEISCISALEGQAAGTPMITTNNFALPETVGDGGVLIDGSPTDAEYVDEFVRTTLHLLDDDEARQKLVDRGKRRIVEFGYTWDAIAATWEHKFQTTLEERWRKNKPQILRNMLRQNDVLPVARIADREHVPELVEEAKREEARVVGQAYAPTHEEIKADFGAAIGRYRKVLAMLEMAKCRPKRVLDWCCRDAAFGFFFKQAFPDSEVTLFPVNTDTAERLAAYREKTGVDVEIVDELPEEKYDLLFLGDTIEQFSLPQTQLKTVFSKHLEDAGRCAFTASYGTRRGVYRGHAERLWNFDWEDLRQLFPEEFGLQLTFHEDAISDSLELLGHWCGIVKNKTSFGKPDLKGKALRTRPYQSLAAFVMVKDEEDWIRGCVKRLREVADRVVVVDTGSSDKTVGIAEELGCEVRHVEFQDFGQARNEGKAGLTEDWIAMVDADERLVGANRLRRYLYGGIFEGYALKQNHLMLDLPGTYDLPVRVYRNRPHYQYTGAIHEHCENTEKGPYDNPIAPSMALPDVQLAHYGYEDERMRRSKCSERNLRLLQRDIELHGSQGRMLTRVLQIRDYLNMVKWDIEKTGGYLDPGSSSHELLEAAVADYRHYFGDRKHRYHVIVFGMYQEALEILGRNGVPYKDRKFPPFQVGFMLAGSLGGLSDQEVPTQKIWFLDDDELLSFSRRCGAQLAHDLGLGPREKYKEFLTDFGEVDDEPVADPIALLEHGVAA